MAARRPLHRNNHLEEAMALLIRNQAAFVEQIARNDQERLKLQIRSEDWQRRTEDWQRKTEDWQRKTEDWQRKTEDWQRKAEERFDKIEQRLAKIEESIIELPKIVLKSLLEQLPKAVKKEIGFKSPA
ncbi:MAG TPA: hypothetical protein VLL54_12515 [Pyrinomonadaceae bacterium]|nr:hypothetical protein [Pyrinomonadaceae bacterium]